MRVAYLTSRYPAVSHTFVRREVEALRALGAQIHTYSVREVGPEDRLSPLDEEAHRTTTSLLPVSPAKLLSAHGRAFVASPARYSATLAFALRRGGRSPKRLLWQLFYFAEAALLWQSMRRQGVRHVHAHMANVAADVARLAAHLGSSPAERWSWSFTMHGPTEFFDVEKYGLADKVRDATFVVCISDFARSQLMALSEPGDWPKLRVVHCGVDVTMFAPTEKATDGPLRILCVGRLVPEKAQALIIEAVAALRAEGLDCRLDLIGRGPTEEHLRTLIDRLGMDEHVTLHGAAGQETVRRFFDGAHVFCLPSAAEGVPMVLMEAMAAELPVVSTRIAGIPELVNHESSGLLVRPGRSDEVTDALRRLLVDESLRRRMGQAGRQKVMNEFEVNACAAALATVFEDYLG